MELLISITPIILISIFLHFQECAKIKKSTIIKVLLLGIISITLVALVFVLFPSLGQLKAETDSFISEFIILFLVAGFLEEFAKWINIKITKPKDEKEAFLFSILVAFTFTFLENILYTQNALELHSSSGLITTGLCRAIIPGHVLFQIIMGYLLAYSIRLMKQKKHILWFFMEFVSLIVPALLHSLFDTLLIHEQTLLSVKSMSIAIITDLLILWGIAYYNKFLNKSENVNKFILNILSIVLVSIVVFVSIWSTTVYNNSKYISLNKTLEVPLDNIEITVTKANLITVDNQLFDSYNGTYLQVMLEVKNNNPTSFEFLDFNSPLLIDKSGDTILVSNITYDTNNNFPKYVDSNDTATGYLYFKTNYLENLHLMYTTHNTSSNNKVVTYYFNLE